MIPSCWTPALRTIPETRSPYDVLPSKALDRLAKARDLFARGEVASAEESFRALAHEFPKNVPTAIWLQEADRAALPVDRSEELRSGTEAAEREPTPENLVAARVEPDAEAARVLLERAGLLDRACPWPAHGRACGGARATGLKSDGAPRRRRRPTRAHADVGSRRGSSRVRVAPSAITRSNGSRRRGDPRSIRGCGRGRDRPRCSRCSTATRSSRASSSPRSSARRSSPPAST
jgi:hypothetical protein